MKSLVSHVEESKTLFRGQLRYYNKWEILAAFSVIEIQNNHGLSKIDMFLSCERIQTLAVHS